MNAPTNNSAAALLSAFAPIAALLESSEVSELVINEPNVAMIETRGQWTRHSIDFGEPALLRLGSLIAAFSRQTLTRTTPILSASLPRGERVQIVVPPAARSVSITIRKPSEVSFSLDDYANQGFFNADKTVKTPHEDTQEIKELVAQGLHKEAFKMAVVKRKNILISGATGSGKTTFARALIQCVPSHERVISIENVDELKLRDTHENAVALFYSAGGQGESKVDQKELLESSLRMKPDRIFLAELIRGDEAFYFLRNVNSGHSGSVTTIHANSAAMAIEQLALFLKESSAGRTLQRADVLAFIRATVDVIVQVSVKDNRRFVSDIVIHEDKGDG